MSSFRIGLIQLAVTANKAANLTRAVDKIQEASKNGAKLVSLPEIFNSPYGTNYFPQYAEPVPEGESCQALSKAAKENGIFLIGGSIPEREGDDLFNTWHCLESQWGHGCKVPQNAPFRHRHSRQNNFQGIRSFEAWERIRIL